MFAAQAAPGRSPWPTGLAVWVLLLGLVTTAGLTRRAARHEEAQRERTWQTQVDALTLQVQTAVVGWIEVAASVRHLYSISDQISPEALEEFVGKGMAHQVRLLGRFGLAQRIPAAMRPAVESLRQAPLLEVGPEGFEPAGERSQYFILIWQFPAASLSLPPGYDFGSRPADLAAIHWMQAQGAPALGGPPFSGGPHVPSANARLIFLPFLEPRFQGAPVAPPGYLSGFAVTWLEPARLLRLAGIEEAAPGWRIDLRPATAPAPARFQQPLPLANETWILSCEPPAGAALLHWSNAPLLTGLVGLLLSALLGLLFAIQAAYTRRVEAAVQRRTAQWETANRQLQIENEERARLECELSDIGRQTQERLGRDLHDSLGQQLTGAACLTAALHNQIRAQDPAAADTATEISGLLKSSIAQVRRIARGLSPVELDSEGLPTALERLGAEMQYAAGLEIRVACAPDVHLPSGAVATHLFLIAQEGLTNAVRHAQARQITLTLRPTAPDAAELSIADDGRGLDPAATPPGAGLRILRHRAALIGGQITVGPTTGGGTTLVCRFPT